MQNNEIDWIGTWRAVQQLREPHNNPQEIDYHIIF